MQQLSQQRQGAFSLSHMWLWGSPLIFAGADHRCKLAICKVMHRMGYCHIVIKSIPHGTLSHCCESLRCIKFQIANYINDQPLQRINRKPLTSHLKNKTERSSLHEEARIYTSPTVIIICLSRIYKKFDPEYMHFELGQTDPKGQLWCTVLYKPTFRMY